VISGGDDSRTVRIVEVGPRDGLQNESQELSTAVKIELVDRLGRSGLPVIETTSFVSPKAVPQLADGAEVMAGISRVEGVSYPVLVPNLRGYEAALAVGATSIAVFTAASESFNQRNINTDIAGSIARFEDVVERAHEDGLHVRGYVSCAFGCPFEGPIDPDAVRDVAARLLDLGIADLSIGDTIGVAAPSEIPAVCEPLLGLADVGEIALHLHDTRGTALSNVWAALPLGIRTFDTSVAGLGGCPFAPGATGNLATEDLVWFLHRNGYETGIDLDSVIETANWIADNLGRKPAGHIATTRVWP
jgi:hydroxymethylglutaryl-CoA lyase